MNIETVMSMPCIDHGGNRRLKYKTITRGGVVYNLHRLLCGFTNNMPLTTIEPWVTRHMCGNPRCIRVEHLQVGTTADNQADMVRHGTSTRGERHPGARLCEQDVREIRHMAAEGMTEVQIADAFNISAAHAGNIVRRQAWSHVD